MTKKSMQIVKEEKRVELKKEGKAKRIVVKVATRKVKEVMKVAKNRTWKAQLKAKKIKNKFVKENSRTFRNDCNGCVQ